MRIRPLQPGHQSQPSHGPVDQRPRPAILAPPHLDGGGFECAGRQGAPRRRTSVAGPGCVMAKTCLARPGSMRRPLASRPETSAAGSTSVSSSRHPSRTRFRRQQSPYRVARRPDGRQRQPAGTARPTPAAARGPSTEPRPLAEDGHREGAGPQPRAGLESPVMCAGGSPSPRPAGARTQTGQSRQAPGAGRSAPRM